MSLMKGVDGVAVPMTDAEEAALRAEWAANDAKPPEATVPSVHDEVRALKRALKEKGTLNDADIDTALAVETAPK